MGLQPYLGLRGNALLRAAVWLVVCPAFTCYGYNMSVVGGILTLDSFSQQFPQMDTINASKSEEKLRSQIQGTVVALYTVGGIFGALSCIYLGDRWGRRKVIFITNVVAIIGAILMATSFKMSQFIVARLVLGLGTGGYVATVPVWQSEISPAHKRGSNVVTDGIFIGVGVSGALWIDLGFYFITGNSVSWRFPLAFPILFSVMVAVFITMLPESPRWLLKQGRTDEARQILAALQDEPEHSAIINGAIHDIEVSLTQATGSWRDMFTMGEQRLFHRAYLAATGQMFQQMCGVNLITFYATTIFQQYLGMDPMRARILAAGMTLTQPFGGLFAFFTIDRMGRRPLMLVSAAAMAVSMAILAGTTSAENNTGALVVAVIFLYVFQFIFTVGYSGLTFLYAAEMAPLQIRAAVNAVSTATVWAFNFLLAEITPVGFASISYRYYIIFAVINACIVPSVYFFFPETKGRSLEEIDEIFTRSKSIFDPVRVARSMPKMQIGHVHAEAGDSSSTEGPMEGELKEDVKA
ncbi:general substrate transporter [Aspergillus campestris IBT 28561]|uniref:General substrate transporter n=1 Tax=Aspergillus campestris (strain IBT 28561) TaxID=1392248 RepID=A0A2I1DDL9_ASPC2|nr:general substrate transporter [Aspergillus campestris IBT 28561]PKY07978.1 general substrate transporter [Aspergillus campestris IBT 28561]